MRMNLFILPAAILALSVPVRATEVDYGVQLGLAIPNGDLSTFVNNNVGAELGFSVQIDLGGGQQLRPRLTGTALTGDTYRLATVSFTREASLGFLGLDYLWYPQGNTRRGAYLLGGIGYSANDLTIDTTSYAAFGPGQIEVKASSSHFAYTAGAGYQFNRRWAIEARYNGTQWTYDSAATGHLSSTLSTTSLVGTFRFGGNR